jgi:hypothetical protein
VVWEDGGREAPSYPIALSNKIPWLCDDHGTDPAHDHILQALDSDLTPQIGKATNRQTRMLAPLPMPSLHPWWWTFSPQLSRFRAPSLPWARAVWTCDGYP